MIRSIAKHSYIKGANGGVRSGKHINYIAHRDGLDRNEGGRKFFSSDRNDISAREVKHLMCDDIDGRGVAMHKFVLSPGIETVDMKNYTRELMDELSRSKGKELEWCAVVHDNTEHKHVHVVISGKDQHGGIVRFGTDDYRLLRESGDDYLTRNHRLERYLDREIPDLLRANGRERSHDDGLGRLLYGSGEIDKDRKKKELDLSHENPERDRFEFLKFDEDMRKAFGAREGRDLYVVRGKQWNLEQSGRLSDFHTLHGERTEEQRLQNLKERFPDQASSFEDDLRQLRESAGERRANVNIDSDVYRLIWGDARQSESSDRSRNQDHRQLVSENAAIFSSPDDGHHIGGLRAGAESADEAYTTFENDREVNMQTQSQDERRQDRGDDECDRYGGGLA
jgi:hypothetical protein